MGWPKDGDVGWAHGIELRLQLVEKLQRFPGLLPDLRAVDFIQVLVNPSIPLAAR
jgi:hypothetical protein